MLWALLAFLLNFVPTVGSFIAAVPAVLLALVQLGVLHAGLTLGGFVVVNLVMGNVIEPRWMGRGFKPVAPSCICVFGTLGMGAGACGDAAVDSADYYD